MTGTELALVITAVCTGVGTLLTSVGGFIVLLGKLRDVHDLTNHKMDELLDVTRLAALERGKVQGADAERASPTGPKL